MNIGLLPVPKLRMNRVITPLSIARREITLHSDLLRHRLPTTLLFYVFILNGIQQIMLNIVGDTKMNDYGALVDDFDGVKLKCYKKNPLQCHLIHHKSHVDWPGLGSDPPRRQPGD